MEEKNSAVQYKRKNTQKNGIHTNNSNLHATNASKSCAQCLESKKKIESLNTLIKEKEKTIH